MAVKTQLANAGAAGFAGNVIVGGVVGMAVDAASGATNEHCPNPVAVTLRRLDRNGRPMGEPVSPAAHCQPPLTPDAAAQASGHTAVQ